jgi:hypothetical protein
VNASYYSEEQLLQDRENDVYESNALTNLMLDRFIPAEQGGGGAFLDSTNDNAILAVTSEVMNTRLCFCWLEVRRVPLANPLVHR